MRLCSLLSRAEICEDQREKQDPLTPPAMQTFCFVFQHQLQAYVAWVNSQLKKKPAVRPVQDLRQDLRDGVTLALLIEIVGQCCPSGPVFPPQLWLCVEGLPWLWHLAGRCCWGWAELVGRGNNHKSDHKCNSIKALMVQRLLQQMGEPSRGTGSCHMD